MKFLNDQRPEFDLTYNDVFLVPQESSVGSRLNVNLTTPDNIGTTLPLVVSNMTAVAGKRMAETMARRGGIVVIPQDIPLDKVQETVEYVKSRHTVFETPVTLKESHTIEYALSLINKRAHGAVVIVNEKEEPIGIFTEADAEKQDRFMQLGNVMTRSPLCFEHSLAPEEMYNQLYKSRRSFAPVTKNGKLIGAITAKGAVRSTIYQPAVDKSGKLIIAVAVGINGDPVKKATQLDAMGVDVLVLDTAHGHQEKMVSVLKNVRAALPSATLVAGNVVTKEATKDLIEAGADIVKVGVGPGAMCTTRMMTGVGRPQLSAVIECSAEARKHGKHVWADGGVRMPRDVALALAAGASSVMFGSWWAGTYEAAADTQRDGEGRLYKESYGMASGRAVSERSQDESPFNLTIKSFFKEGISTSKMYLRTDTPGAEDIVDQIAAGVRSACTYSGADDIESFRSKAVIGVQSSSGYNEGKPVPTSW